jgi:drug/metabolite transporter (DMT)-like permease
LYTGIVSGGLGFTLQVIAQRHTPPAEAALIMSLESVFAFVGGALLLGERLHRPAMVGCGMILLAVLIVELVPVLRRQRTGAIVS